MKILSPDSFFPIKWYEASNLWFINKTSEEWDLKFKDSLTVHFYQSSWRHGDNFTKINLFNRMDQKPKPFYK